MERLAGKVAFVSGAARGQGRSHAVRLAEEGADIIAVDSCADVHSAAYPMATRDEFDETVALVEKLDRRIVFRIADVRDNEAVAAALSDGVAELGRLDIVVANAGIVSNAPIADLGPGMWGDVVDINLTGVYNTARNAVPYLIEAGSGAMVFTGSALGTRPMQNSAHYVAAKAGVVGLMRALALELAPHLIRVNTVSPSMVNTKMIHNEAMYRLFLPDIETPTPKQAEEAFSISPMPFPWVEANDVSNAVAFLVSEEARYVTGQDLKIDCGFSLG
ncbi:MULTISPECIES: mycofactocin-coupled SDR family oxidoreductase [unclassified Rhodococcus (in: high G+C Gram-positive bacteria)]|uniref:mycofactocin-coupled SDR family oxidoreductase n=1 Tax=unclassified Rhodococcus (in: high G+C Gram-positive bacteria) TaxID=192944 RepID=UPI00163A5D82|nr:MULTISPECIES: mycofactocin-coupled SDR family oxidoreductase [unclassified Rhodococcus (in: high G+C Gram-positive bacteria)]MBC2637606.1 mycofactocin-coupled SDR family oxidoreductase [Rhodococcus sp. 3A]MBC2644257.1 mycofactocin-coupled SDR family oxidoreductase [Rhodococcus sp. 3A]MBC2891005.1 mycofactocin-coupled SDR family oxidoreductase [Rhodococcus sp. 4CII]MBC2897650.1 mycofactocin-coupled SDR family oxidoreductase [Rhodococcus sp. 4CII]